MAKKLSKEATELMKKAIRERVKALPFVAEERAKYDKVNEIINRFHRDLRIKAVSDEYKKEIAAVGCDEFILYDDEEKGILVNFGRFQSGEYDPSRRRFINGVEKKIDDITDKYLLKFLLKYEVDNDTDFSEFLESIQ